MDAKKCSRCKDVKPLADFCKWSRSKDGYQPACKQCMNASWNASRNKRKDHYHDVQMRRRSANRARIDEWKSERGCSACGERYVRCLELHHLDPKEKDLDPTDANKYSWDVFLKEAAKCVVLCANCHRKVHGGALVLVNLGVA